LLGFQHDLAGITACLGLGAFVDPLTVLLPIHTAAGHKQQVLGLLAVVVQPLQHMPQPLHVCRTITRLVVIGGGRAIHQVIHPAHRPGIGAVFIEQVAGNPDNALGKARNIPPQAMNLPALGQQLGGQTATDIAATGNHHRRRRHHKTPFLKVKVSPRR